MALKKKAQPVEVEEVTETVKPKKKKVEAGGSSKTPAQLAHELLKKDKKVMYESEVIFDPDAPLVSAEHWIQMPYPWEKLTGTKGIPFGQVTTIQGKPDSGKTTVAMHGMVEAQEQGFNVVLIDTEHKFNMKRLKNMGGDIGNFHHIKAETIEQGFAAIEELILIYHKINKKPTLFVWDSLGMTPTEEELKKDSAGYTVASAAKVIKKNLRRLRSMFSKYDAGIVFINQVYDNLNALFGNSTKGYGGNGAYYASALVLEVQRIRNKEKQINNVKKVVGVISGMKCTKNHLSDVQGAKAEVLIGPNGIEAQSVKDMDSEDLDDAHESIEDEIGTPQKNMKNGREFRL